MQDKALTVARNMRHVNLPLYLNTRDRSGEHDSERHEAQEERDERRVSQRGTDTFRVYQVSWPCLFDSKQFRWNTAVFTEADNSFAVWSSVAQPSPAHSVDKVTNNGKFHSGSRQPTVSTMSTNNNQMTRKHRMHYVFHQMEKEWFGKEPLCIATKTIQSLLNLSPADNHQLWRWKAPHSICPQLRHFKSEGSIVSVEKNREELPVSLSLSYFRKWIYNFEVLTCPPRQDSLALTQPCKLLLTLTMKRLGVQITELLILKWTWLWLWPLHKDISTSGFESQNVTYSIWSEVFT